MKKKTDNCMIVTCGFNYKGKKIEFKVCTNLSYFGLNIQDALVSWSFRTTIFTSKDFCEYAVSKDPENLICYLVD